MANKKQKINQAKPTIVVSFSGFLLGNNNEVTAHDLANAFYFVGACLEFCMSPEQDILDSYSTSARTDEELLNNLKRFQAGLLSAVEKNNFRRIRTHQDFLNALVLVLGLSGNDYKLPQGDTNASLIHQSQIVDYLQRKGFRLLGHHS